MRIGDPMLPGSLEVEELLKTSRTAIVKEMEMVGLREGTRSADKRTIRALLMVPLLILALYSQFAFLRALVLLARSFLPF
jgi:hypothetical protein